MKCIKTGFNLQVGAAVYRADLHMENGRLFASVNRYPLEDPTAVADVVCTSYLYDVTHWPNYELDKNHCVFTKDFFRAVCKINPDLQVSDFVGIDIQ